MNNEKFIVLMEKFLENELSSTEEKEFNEMIHNDPELKAEFEEQVEIKKIIRSTMLKNPEKEIWDGYWIGVYNRMERNLSWVLISIGALLITAYVLYEFVINLFLSEDTPELIRYGVILIILGGFVLLFSVIREKILTSKADDKYREIQR